MKHFEDVAPSSVHQFAFVSETDPALDIENEVDAYKAWFTPSTQLLKYRNATNTEWVTLGENT